MDKSVPQKNQASSIRVSVNPATGTLASYLGGSILRAISSVSPTLGGKVAHTVDVVGKALGNPLPDLGATEEVQSKGGYSQMVKTEQNKNLSEQERQKKLQELEQKTKQTTGSGSAKSYETKSVDTSSYDPNWRAKALQFGEDVNSPKFAKFREIEAQLNQQNQNTNSPPLGRKGVENIASALGLTSEEMSKLDLSKWEQETADRADRVAKEIERAAIENAEREYNTILDALRTQKGEVGTLATQHRQRLKEQKEFTEQGLTKKEQSEIANIEKQKTAFEEEMQDTKEELARAWRELSLETQRLMRARGIQDSSFAASNDAKLMMDFNRGLRKIAAQSQAALKDFSDAVIETNKYYTRERQKLDMDYNQALTDIDNWERQQIQSIQAQENMALTRKLNEIRNAVAQANQLRENVAQKISDQKMGLAVWMAQFQMQLKAAVATAAAGKVDDAWKNIAAVRQNVDLVKSIRENGGTFVKMKTKDGSDQWFVHGAVPNSDGSWSWTSIPVTEDFVKLQALKEQKSLQPDINDVILQNPNIMKKLGNIYGNINKESYPSWMQGIVGAIGSK
jgi:hypothetical protein